MKKLLFAIIVLLFWTSSSYVGIGNTQSLIPAENEDIPSYAKWGRMAMKETGSKYPEANIVDYLHIGREVKGENTVEKFKLWLKTKEKEFGVFVNIEFMTETEDIVSITFQETDR